MIHVQIGRVVKLFTTLVLALGIALVVAGCGGKPADTTPKTGTAKAGLLVAKATLSTMAPEAKLLLVQTAARVTPTATPVWGYLFGSPKNDKTYIVYVAGGKAMPASEYGAAGLSASDWSAVPGTDSWKIDSDEAYRKALAANGAKGAPAAYNMGFITYVPPSETTSETKTFLWYVEFEPAASGGTTSTIEVDAKTGVTVVR